MEGITSLVQSYLSLMAFKDEETETLRGHEWPTHLEQHVTYREVNHSMRPWESDFGAL
jgi:hypothetical protein